METSQSVITIKGTPYSQALYESAPEMYEACKKLIMHKHQDNLHPIDFQRIEQAIAKAEGRE